MDLVFNIAKGKVAYYAGLPDASDALLVVPLLSSGLASDATLVDLTGLVDVLNNSTEAPMGRQVVSAANVNVDNVNDRTDVDMADVTWPGATGAAVGALVICYLPYTGAPDSEIIPLTKHDFAVTPNGSDITAQVSTSGFYRAL